jgi:RHS repeat-associated protein
MRHLVFLVAYLVLPGLLWGQAAADLGRSTGIPTTIYSGSALDSVDTQSGNLHITLPLLYLPGRGLNTDVVLTYNSKLWQTNYIPPTNPDDPYPQATIDLDMSGSGGWHLGMPRIGWSNPDDADECLNYDFNGNCTADIIHGTFHGDDGTTIALVNEASDGSTTGLPMWSFDGSFALLTNRGLTYKDGVTASYNVGPYGPPTSEVLTDTNGNTISCSYPSRTSAILLFTAPVQCLDTLGRLTNFNFPSSSTVGTTTYTDSSGTVQTITLHFASFTLKYPFTDSGQTYCFLRNPNYSQGSFKLLTSITLPNGLSYQFQYLMNADGSTTGELTKIILPTGGYIRYVYGFAPVSTDSQLLTCGYFQQVGQDRMVTQRVVSLDGNPASEQVWSYSAAHLGDVKETLQTTVTDPLGNSTVYSRSYGVSLPYQIDYRNSAGTLVKSVQSNVERPPAPSQGLLYYYYSDSPNSNPRYSAQTVILPDTNQQSQTTFTYDTFNNVTEKDETDWGSGAPGPVIRKTTYAYLHGSNPAYAADTVHILDRVTSENVCSAAGTFCAQTSTTFDGTTPAATSNVVHHDYTSFPSTYNLRGNPTQVQRRLNTTGALLTTTNAFNDLGDLIQSTDPLGHTTVFDYTDNFYGVTPPSPTLAFVTKTTLPTTGGVSHIIRKQYYFDSGLLAADCGQNFTANPCTFGLAAPQPDYSSYTYDSMNRRLLLTNGDGGQNSLSYNEAALPISITSTTRINSVASLTGKTIYDGLGRTSQTQLTSDPQGTVFTDTTYDALGRVAAVSNPYRGGTDPTSSPGITTFIYDALGRKCVEVPPDGTAVPGNTCPASAPAKDIFTSYSGNTTTVTDSAGRKRQSTTDALGRLTQVVEDPGGLGYITNYSYDALGNLTSVVQNGSHQRSFTYDSLSHLLTSTNPETGTICYGTFSGSQCQLNGYDADGNLVAKTDARGITTTYAYDPLNREISRTYSNGDPTITTHYDEANCLGLAQCANIGQRTSMTDAAGSESWSFDVVDRMHRDLRTTGGITKTTTYNLDFAGNITSATYPTGRVVNYTFDAANRPSTAADGSNGITYATGMQSPPSGCSSSAACYTPQGAFYALSIGQSPSFTGLNLTHLYNNRLQPLEFQASSTGGNAIDISYSFVDPVSLGNAGHVFSISNNLNTSRSQSFGYDQLNRITTAGTTATSGTYCWGYQFGYDAWGNLLYQQGWAPNYNGCSEPTMSPVTLDGNNHISAFAYDASGNATNDGAFAYTWDAESQMKTAAGVTYTYDGDGRRVIKSNGKIYWYGSGGEILAETDAVGNTLNEYIFFGGKRIAMLPSGSSPLYYVEDFLGTSRVITQSNGMVCYDADFDPFGGEHPYINTCPQNYKFEGKERDTETGNDDFGARYYSNRYGRWLSADWSSVPVPVPYANLTNPQTLNLYAMVADDPESFADLDGHQNGTAYGCQEAASDAACRHADPQQQAQDAKAQNTMSTADKAKLALDVAGFIPVVGDFANLGSAVISVGQGHFGEAALSAVAAIPLVGVVGEGAKGAKIAKEAEEAVSVYKKAETAYVGISKNLAQRELQHGEKLVEVAGGLTRQQARGVEQAIIEQKGLAKNGGALTNKINSIAKTNSIYKEAVEFGKQLLKSISF